MTGSLGIFQGRLKRFIEKPGVPVRANCDKGVKM